MNTIYSHLTNIIINNYGLSGMYVHVLHTKVGNKEESHSCDQESRFNQTLPTSYMASETVSSYCVVLNLKIYKHSLS
jgi:hypothetical protein